MPRNPGRSRALDRPSCDRRCGFGRTLRGHHDRLLLVDTDLDEMLDLMELAVTWGELDYSNQRVIPPAQWLDFLDGHQWRDPSRAARIFTLATDIALRSSGLARHEVRTGAGALLRVVSAS